MAHERRIALHDGQLAIVNSPALYKVVAAGRRFGKSHVAAHMLLMAAMQRENQFGYKLGSDIEVYYVAPTLTQAREIMWPKLHELGRDLIARKHEHTSAITLHSGRTIRIKGADEPDRLRGMGLSFVVMDEYADMKPFVWDEIIMPTLADVNGEALFIGTPKGKNHFYKLFVEALEYEHDPRRDGPVPLWEAFNFKTTDNPFLSKQSLRAITSNMGSQLQRQELEANFISGDGKVLKPEWFQIVDFLPEHPDDYQVAVTVDLAGFVKQGGRSQKKLARLDDSVICVTALARNGDWYILDVQYGKWEPRETALRIVRTITKYPGCKLGIERGHLEVAIREPLEEYMREFRRYVTPTPLKHGNQKKADRIQWALQGRAERGKIKLLQGDWNAKYLEQIADFPDPLAHDDLIDASAYADQLLDAVYIRPDDVEDEFEPLDLIAGW